MSEETATWFENIREHFGFVRREIAALNAKLDSVIATQERLLQMSTSLSAQLAADFTAVMGELGNVSADVTEITSDVGSFVAQFAVGNQLTQAQVDQAHTILASLQTIDTGLQAVHTNAQTALSTPVTSAPITTSGFNPVSSGTVVSSGGTVVSGGVVTSGFNPVSGGVVTSGGTVT